MKQRGGSRSTEARNGARLPGVAQREAVAAPGVPRAGAARSEHCGRAAPGARWLDTGATPAALAAGRMVARLHLLVAVAVAGGGGLREGETGRDEGLENEWI